MKKRYCAKCNKEYPIDLEDCPLCGKELISADDVADISEIDPQIDISNPELKYDYASPWKRVLAFIIDLGIIYAIAYISAFAAGFVLALLGMQYAIQYIVKIAPLIDLLLTWSYFIILTKTYHATIGKQAMKLFVLSSNNMPLTWGQVIIRETLGKIVSNLILGIGYIYILFNKKRQGWHDLIANTYVMERKTRRHIAGEFKGKSREEYDLIRCPHCKLKHAVHKSEEYIQLSCPSCKHEFNYRTKNRSIINHIIEYLNDSGGKESIGWFNRAWAVLLLIIFYLPAGIILLWVSPLFKRYMKILISLFMAVLVMALFMPNAAKDIATKSTVEYLFEAWQKDKGEIFLPRAQLFGGIAIRDRGLRRQLTASYLAKTRSSSVVTISVYDVNNRLKGQGSGFIIARNGVIATNYHVIANAKYIKVRLENGDIYENVKLVEAPTSSYMDIAIIKIDGSNMPAVTMGDSDKIEIGEDVVAIGNPMGYERTVSKGIISARREYKGIELLQITAPISPGNSGGPLFNMNGEVVGITTLISYPGFAQNLNFAIPVNYLKRLIGVTNIPHAMDNLAAIKRQLLAMEAEIKEVAGKISARKKRIDEVKYLADKAISSGYNELYDSYVKEYNKLIKEYNQIIVRYKEIIQSYENKIKIYNQKIEDIKRVAP